MNERSMRTVGGYVGLLVVFAAVHFSAERLALAREMVTGNAAPVWLASAVALAIVFLFGYRYLPAIALGALAANLMTGVALIAVFGATLGALAEAGVGAWLLHRAGFRPNMERLADAVSLVLLGAGVATAVSATFGVTSLWLSDGLQGNPFWRVWSLWWFANLTSVVIASPLIFLATARLRERERPEWKRALVFAGYIAVLVGAAVLIFARGGAPDPYIRPFLIFPVMLVVTLRFGPFGAAAANATLAAIAVFGTYSSMGPFGTPGGGTGDPFPAGLLAAQVFVTAVGITTLALAGAIAERSQVQSRLAEADRRYQTLVEAIPAATYIDTVVDKGSGLATIYVSPQVESMLGYAPDAFMADSGLWHEILHPDDADAVKEADLVHYRDGTPLRTQARMRHLDGHWVWVRDEAVILYDYAGHERVSQGILLDVTALTDARVESDRLHARLVEAQEEERRRIASDIHDDPLQKMTAVGIRLEGLRRRLAPAPEADATVDQLQSSVEQAIARLRHLMFELRPPALDEQGLAAAIESYLYQEARDGLSVGVDDQLTIAIGQAQRAVLYRIAQEAIRNVLKHADASRIDVTLTNAREGVNLRVQDDGKGFDEQAAVGPEHIGLATLRERAAMAGGACSIRSTPGHGTVVEAWIPA